MRIPPPNSLAAITFIAALLAGCDPKATTHVISVPTEPDPIVEIEAEARDLLAQVARDQKLGPDWWVRLEVVWRTEAQIDVTVEKQPPGPRDFFVEADGLHVVMPEDQKVYLKGARISLLRGKKGIAFDVTFPYRDGLDQQLASEWLQRETAKRRPAKSDAPR